MYMTCFVHEYTNIYNYCFVNLLRDSEFVYEKEFPNNVGCSKMIT